MANRLKKEKYIVDIWCDGEEITFNNISMNMKTSQNKDISNNILIILISEIVLLAILLIIYLKEINKKEELI